MRVGERDVGTPVYLAPMAGVTNEAFRRLCHEEGATVVMSEMVSARALVMGNERTTSMMGVAADEHPVAIQLFGSEPDIVAEAAQQAEAFGADMVDLNLGCPVEKIVKGGNGAALMREPARAAEVVARAARAISIPFTVKMRAGWDEVTAPDVARRLVDAGAQAVAIHCRTRQQQYRGQADWTILERVREAVPSEIGVIGNGDILDAEDALTVVRQHGADGVMIGRGSLGNPWIFRDVSRALREGTLPRVANEVGPDERLDMLLRHFRLLLSLAGERRATVEIRQHASHYVRGLPGAAEARTRFMRETTQAGFEGAVEAFRAELHDGAGGERTAAGSGAFGDGSIPGERNPLRVG